MPSVYHLSACLPYDTKNPIQQISEKRGFRFTNLPEKLNGDSAYLHVKKLIWSRNFILNNIDLLNSVVMFTDAHDVLILSDSDDIIGRFFQQDCDLLFSAEKLFSPWLHDEKAYRADVKKYFEKQDGDVALYPNTGCWIGYGWAALDFLNVVIEYAEAQNDGDDQRVVQDILAREECPAHIRVKIDTDQRIFVSVIANGDDITWRGNRIFYKDRADPIPVFHANGYKKSIEFIQLYNEIYYRTANSLIDVRAVKQNNRYLGISNGSFSLSERYCAESVSALIKAGRVCCFFTNDGEILSFVPNDSQINVVRLPVDNWERHALRNINESMEPYLKEKGNIHFEYHILNHIWGFYKPSIHFDIVKYFYNL